MHTDDHILETFLASNKPLAAIASDLSITLIALVRWMDKNVDLLAAAKRAMETRITFLALHAEAVALTDLTNVSHTSTNEERKRKSASQLLRHSAKRLLGAVGGTTNPKSLPSTNPGREPGAPSATESPLASTHPNAESRMPNAASSPNALPSTNPGREPGAPCTSVSRHDAPMPSASMPSTNPGREPGAPCVSVSRLAPPHPNASSPPHAASSLSDHEIDVLMATLAHHFNVDFSNLADEPDPAPDSTSDSPSESPPSPSQTPAPQPTPA